MGFEEGLPRLDTNEKRAEKFKALQRREVQTPVTKCSIVDAATVVDSKRLEPWVE